MPKKIALVDLDFVLCDWSEGIIPELKKLESPEEATMNYDYSDTWKLGDKYPYIENRIRLVMSKRGIWKNLKPIWAGMRLYRDIEKRFDTYILSKASKHCDLVWGEKAEWVHRHLGYETNMMLVTDKKHICGDLLFDDMPENAEYFLELNPKGRVIMPIRKHNEFLLFGECDDRIALWDDSPTEEYISGDIKLDVGHDEIGKKLSYDFTVPHKVIEEVLKCQ